MEGHGDALGHLSLRDPAGRGFWLKRNRIALGEVVRRRRLRPGRLGRSAARRLGRPALGGRSIGNPARAPHVQVVAQPIRSMPAWSRPPRSLQPYGLDADYFIDVPRHIDQVALITTKEEGAALARARSGFRGVRGEPRGDVRRHPSARDLRRRLF